MKEYLKYYWLETEYLEEVRLNFLQRGYLTAKELCTIVAWKNPKFGIRKLSRELLTDVGAEKLTRSISGASTREERLHVLLYTEDTKTKRKGIKLATASAILTILYPEEYTVYDIRVRKQLRSFGIWSENPDDITDKGNVVELYFSRYLDVLLNLAKENDMTLRDLDRALWAKDWNEDLESFLEK